MKSLAAAIGGIALLSALPALAQNLTKAQAGLAAVGQCYSACSERSNNRAIEGLKYLASSFIWVHSDDFYYHDFMQDPLTDYFLTLYCGGMVMSQDEDEDCARACVDVERAYGVRSGQGRTAFIAELRENRNSLTSLGLWNNGRRIADSNQFKQSCLSYFGRGEDAASVGQLEDGEAIKGLMGLIQEAPQPRID